MKHYSLLLLCLVAAAAVLCSAGCVTTDVPAGAVVVNQTNGDAFTLDHTAERIVLMNSNAAEMLYVMGAADKVVGVSQSIADHAELGPLFPHAVSVGKWDVPDIETISSLSPDVVIAFSTSKPLNADAIEAAGIPICYIDCYKPVTMAADVAALGVLTGNSAKAEEFAVFYTGVLDSVTNATAGISFSPSVYCEGYTDYSGQAKGSGMDLLMEHAGGRNVLTQEMGATSPKVSPEWLIAENPDVMIKVLSVKNMESAADQYAKFTGRAGFANLDAVAENRTYLIRNDIAYGPRTFAGAVAVAKMLHPEAAAHLSVRAVLDEYNTRFGLNVSAGEVVYPAFA
ncbi:ABC transporter substrate-binding protein [Methanocorpusculum sp. MG]|uniref:ABC transporter substrate-binding protein n=1 Tax=Methanocorpusculum petauri TaxID=3002863 RepID=A0ABT4IEF0_9EURY|nr:ABC transporter substrate-binding protein [Methanocorpusculum petauri]MCZ0859632.1 ABC transporter substrate-binding protein [Methanocorpusculum petauri]MDE2443120.1 ABC transporter substrate-binding protein [Methanocorpusculum sp.]